MRYSAAHRAWWQSVFFYFKIIKRHFHLCISSPNWVTTPHGRSVTFVGEAQNSHTSMPGSHFSKYFWGQESFQAWTTHQLWKWGRKYQSLRNIEGLDKELKEKTVGTCGVEGVSERGREIKKPLSPRKKRKTKTCLLFNLSSHNHCRKNLSLEAQLLSSATRAPAHI